MDTVSLKDIKARILRSDSAKDSYNEAVYRRRIAGNIERIMKSEDLSYRNLAKSMGTSRSQVQRLLNKQRGGGLTFLTLVKASRALGVSVGDLISPNDHLTPCATVFDKNEEKGER